MNSCEHSKQFLNKCVAISCRFAHVFYTFPWQFQWRSVLGLWKNDKSSGSSKRNFCPGGRPVFRPGPYFGPTRILVRLLVRILARPVGQPGPYFGPCSSPCFGPCSSACFSPARGAARAGFQCGFRPGGRPGPGFGPGLSPGDGPGRVYARSGVTPGFQCGFRRGFLNNGGYTGYFLRARPWVRPCCEQPGLIKGCLEYVVRSGQRGRGILSGSGVLIGGRYLCHFWYYVGVFHGMGGEGVGKVMVVFSFSSLASLGVATVTSISRSDLISLHSVGVSATGPISREVVSCFRRVHGPCLFGMNSVGMGMNFNAGEGLASTLRLTIGGDEGCRAGLN